MLRATECIRALLREFIEGAVWLLIYNVVYGAKQYFILLTKDVGHVSRIDTALTYAQFKRFTSIKRKQLLFIPKQGGFGAAFQYKVGELFGLLVADHGAFIEEEQRVFVVLW